MRLLFAAYGSGGDLFPLIPAMRDLASQGHEVRCVVPRALSLYCRAAGIAPVMTGDSSEWNFQRDDQLFVRQDEGWVSWRRTLTNYIAPTLQGDLEVVLRVIDDWRPTVVVASDLAVTARIAACAAGVPLVKVAIYPQHQLLSDSSRERIEQEFRRALPNRSDAWTRQLALDGLVIVPDPDVLMHETALLGSLGLETAPSGYPYWDGLPHDVQECDAARTWLVEHDRTAVVTFGSFIGLRNNFGTLQMLQGALAACGVFALFVGLSMRARDHLAGAENLRTVGYSPLSLLFPCSDLAIHHGGLGTTLAALKGGCPSLVLPQAFDQEFNSGLVETLGIGRRVRGDLATDVAGMFASSGYAQKSRTLRSLLTSGVDAARAVVAAVDGAVLR